ncbi:hypothetical protein ANN_11932 [Periplaneta americana]|uniref:Uncharacterized protein n=1 Tax=Periplaneta americana TaxID=6978 RepID=A0ABQ8T7W0_PERAM|nr:hypothetical protein ANN_11932 [Periplaneta americana]
MPCPSQTSGFNVPNYVRSLPSKETLRGHSGSSFRGEGYIQCCVGVRLCDLYSNQELAEIHFMYSKADGNAALARRLYQERSMRDIDVRSVFKQEVDILNIFCNDNDLRKEKRSVNFNVVKAIS